MKHNEAMQTPLIALTPVRRWLKRFAYALGATLTLWGIAWLAVPPLLKSQVEKIASQQLGRSVTMGSVDFKPWTLELELRDLVVGGASGQAEQLRVGRAYVDAELQSLLRMAPVIDSVQIEGVRGQFAHLGDGRYDFDDILAKIASQPKAEKSGEALPKFAIYNIALRDVAVMFDDRPVGTKHQIRDLNLSLPFLSTLAAQRQVKTQPRLAFDLNGSRFDSTGETTPFVQTRKTDATISIRTFDLAPYLKYLPANMPIKLVAAVLGANLNVSFEQSPQPAVRITGQMQADNLVLQDFNRAPLLSLSSLVVRAQDVQPLTGRVAIESVMVQAPQLQVSRNAAGQLNLLAGSSGPPTKQLVKSVAGADAAKSGTPWEISIQSLMVTEGSIIWTDQTTSPRAKLVAQSFKLEAHQIGWPFAVDKPLPIVFEGSTSVERASLTFSGTATDIQASVTAQLSGLQLAALAPYINGVFTPALTGLADLQAGVLWQAARGAQKEALQITLPKAQVANVLVTQGSTRLAQLKLLSAENGQVDLVGSTASMGKISAVGLQTKIERDANGRWMVQDWLRPASNLSSPPAPAKGNAASSAWKVRVSEISLDAPQLGFVDRAPVEGSRKVVSLDLQQIKARISGFELDGDKLAVRPMPVLLTAGVAPNREGASLTAGDIGKIDITGQLALTPLAMQLDTKLSRIPVHALEPYFGDALNIDVLRLEMSYTGKVQAAQTPQGMQLKLDGDVLAAELQTTLRGAALAASSGAVTGDELLSWSALSLRALSVDVSPAAALKVEVGEVALTDFFARILLSEQGRINLQDIVKSSSSGATTTDTASASATVTSNTPVATNSIAIRADSTGSTSQNAPKSTVPGGLEPMIKVGAISLTNGKVFFSDRFIKPNYAANLSELTGLLGAFSSQPVAGTVQMANLELRGKAEGTASLEILGKLNPLAQPIALDITGKVRDLELAPLSPYSVKFAGHGIERGKLSVDVKYQIQPDGRLEASNNIVLSQLRFGEKVEGAPNSLPVKLAVALLADRNGVIDINLPVSGSLNDPQFSVGGIVFKLIINLVVKAITSPFSLLAGAFGGGGEELGQIGFAPGSAALSVQANPGLVKVVKALQDRPSLKMTVVGQANLDVEREGYKKERLKSLVAAEKRRSTLATGNAAGTATAALTVSDAEYAILIKEVYRRSDVPKPRNAIGMAKDLPVAEMEALLLASLPVTEQAMQELALARGVAVRDYLASQGLTSDRLFLGAAKAVPAGDKWSPRAELSLAAP